MKYIVMISSILVCLLFLVLAITNLYKKNNIIKYALVISIIAIILSIMIDDLIIIDSILYQVIQYIYYPTFVTYIITIIITVSLFIYNLINDKLNQKYRIINYIFAILILISYVVFLNLQIDVSSYKELYGKYAIICIRYATRTFSMWIILLLMIKYWQCFTKRGEKNDS